MNQGRIYYHLLSFINMFRAKIEVFGPQGGELYLWHENQESLENKISFYVWIIENYGYTYTVTRYED